MESHDEAVRSPLHFRRMARLLQPIEGFTPTFDNSTGKVRWDNPMRGLRVHVEPRFFFTSSNTDSVFVAFERHPRPSPRSSLDLTGGSSPRFRFRPMGNVEQDAEQYMGVVREVLLAHRERVTRWRTKMDEHRRSLRNPKPTARKERPKWATPRGRARLR